MIKTFGATCIAALLLSLAIAGAAQTASKKSTTRKAVTPAPAKKPSTGSASRTAGAAAKAPPKTATARTASRKPLPKPPATTWRNRQLAPSPERYKEIQSALATRGYLREDEANGVWNQTSTEALKRFQTEQNIESSGKINSLSLIALGLGPKREGAPVVPPKVQMEPPPGRE